MLHIFDMDGTLLLNTTASLLIAECLDALPGLARLEEQFAGGGLSTAEFAVAIFEQWKDLDEEVVRAAYESAPWIDGIEAVVTDIARRSEESLVITMSPNFFAELLLERGFGKVSSSQFPQLPFNVELDPSRILTPADKPALVLKYCREHHLELDQCVAYGDSMSDQPLFALLQHTVAVNAGPELQRAAAASYRGTNLWDAYQSGRALLSSPTRPPAGHQR